MGKTALIAGATGLVGRALLDQLLSEDFYDKIFVLTRRDLPIKDNRLEVVITRLEDFGVLRQKVHASHYYCCLGTTAKKAGSKEAFFRVDYTYCLELAKMAKDDASCEQFHIVTSLGANSDSVIYYNKVKGLLEEELKQLKLPALHIYQPSLLLGAREEFRFFEELAKLFSTVLSFFMIGSNGKKFFAIEGTKVAAGMFLMARKGEPGVHVYTSGAIERMQTAKKAFTTA